MDPLVIQSRIGELIDPILRDLKPLAHKGLGVDLRD
jgi:hypothetical protein